MENFDEVELDQMIQALATNFLEEAEESLQGVWDLLEQTAAGQAAATETIVELRRQAHNLKGLGGSFGFPSMTLIAHRLEDYVDGQDTLDEHHLEHARSFIEALQDIAESRVNPDDEACARILRTLPAKGSADINFEPSSDLEILVIAPALVLRRAVEAQLHMRGYRVVTLKSPLPAFETAGRSRPDMIIASAMMEGVSGIDLALAFSVMEVTAKTPFVLLTSFERDHMELYNLPFNAAIIRHDLDLDGEIETVLKVLGDRAGSS